jgi:hypothetical protein
MKKLGEQTEQPIRSEQRGFSFSLLNNINVSKQPTAAHYNTNTHPNLLINQRDERRHHRRISTHQFILQVVFYRFQF